MPEIQKQVTIFYTLPGMMGWTERYFLNAQAYSQAKTDADSLLQKRMLLSRNDVKVSYVRISDVGVRGDSVISLAPDTGAGYGETSAGVSSTEAWTALNVRIEGGALYRGRKFIHGLPQSLMLGNIFAPTQIWTDNFNMWAGFLKTACCLWVRDKTVAQPLPPLPPIMTRIGITDVYPIGTTTHHVGRPFGLQVGRRPDR